MPAATPFSRQTFFPWLRNRKFGAVSLATNRSMRPSLLMSVATTPSALPGVRPMAVGAADLAERPVAVVMKEDARRRLEQVRDAVVVGEAAVLVLLGAQRGPGSADTGRSCPRTGRAGRRCRNRTTRRSSSSWHPAAGSRPAFAVTSVNVPSPLLR